MRIYAYNNHLQILKLCSTLFQRYSYESVRSDDLLKVTEQVCGRDRNRSCILRVRTVSYSWASSCKLCSAVWHGIASGYEGKGSTPKSELSCACWVKKLTFASSKLPDYVNFSQHDTKSTEAAVKRLSGFLCVGEETYWMLTPGTPNITTLPDWWRVGWVCRAEPAMVVGVRMYPVDLPCRV